MINLSEIDLIVFDVDGTLTGMGSLNLLDGVKDWFDNVSGSHLTIALASNQGGVGLRYDMEQNGWGDPSSLPTARQAEDRILTLCQLLGIERGNAYQCFIYRFKPTNKDKDGRYAPIPKAADLLEWTVHLNNSWARYWRKPNPGMLDYAVAMHMIRGGYQGLATERTLMVGDRPEDAAAANRAGIKYCGADTFFRVSE